MSSILFFSFFCRRFVHTYRPAEPVAGLEGLRDDVHRVHLPPPHVRRALCGEADAEGPGTTEAMQCIDGR
jgi:hypothetical protein